ncbi:hypothetical protein [Nocardia stercoris]|uniref:Uncharacterized protein n=1 Tax=Nocardia stercoris TaxID=2483361 RepID=A0A3M2KUT8_9NOCA|nr:hypothetical protein [Nocardia stercoris]RMI27983.1 hypothetical protein EBN03_32060 [Nocardia stercoris]
MGMVRKSVAGMLIVGAASVLATMEAGSASALALNPLPGGVEVDLSPGDTQWVHQTHFGLTMSRLPHPSAASFGQSLEAAANLSSQYPDGRVIFTVYGPLDQLNGTMLALQ